jgi:hypothetical protein
MLAPSLGSLVFDCSFFDANSWPSTVPMNAVCFFDDKERKEQERVSSTFPFYFAESV